MPFGTFKFNEFNFIKEYPFPPTSDISGNTFEFKNIIFLFYDIFI